NIPFLYKKINCPTFGGQFRSAGLMDRKRILVLKARQNKYSTVLAGLHTNHTGEFNSPAGQRGIVDRP
ncbi:MAG: hypothetical protein LUH15_07020, partial [Tannerellaceae bacterium]|nr:hypothetical protein [Tannerellaceae bacterium]